MTERPQESISSSGDKQFRQVYSINEKIGKGAFGSVWKAQHIVSGDEFAVKIIDRKKLKPKDDQNVYREINVMKTLERHNNIVSMIEFFETKETFHIVIDLANGGDLMRRLSRRKRYTEYDGRNVAREFLSAIAHIHKCNVIHRDLKPDNLLLEKDDVDSLGVKVGDFGFAKPITNGFLKTRCGTPAYVAPEICVGAQYGKGVDVWSCGVILYLLLSGKIPFTVRKEAGKNHDMKALFLKIRAADYVFDDQVWGPISMPAKQLIAQMLTVDPNRRITIEEALNSTWIMTKDEELESSDKVHLNNTITNLKQFNARRSLKSAIIAATFATTANFWTSDTVSFMSQNTTIGASSAEFTTNPTASTLVNTSSVNHPAPTSMNTSARTLTSGKIGQRFLDLYSLEGKIRGEGGISIWKGIKKDSSETYSVKVVSRGQGSHKMSEEDNKVLNEVSILQSLSHYHVIKLYDFLEESTHFYLVMELMGGGDLFERIVTKEMYTEKDAREVAKALLSAVDYIHSRGIAHRDLKPQNLLLATRDNDTYVKVADFGFAKRVHTPKSLFTRCGTPTYVAPEILKGHPYDQAVDMWSVGVIIYVALVGYPPFLEQDQRVMMEKIRRGKYEFYQEDWGSISAHAKELIKNLLKVDPDSRLSASQALRHKWIAQVDSRDLASNRLKGSLDKLSRRSLDTTISDVTTSSISKSR